VVEDQRRPRGAFSGKVALVFGGASGIGRAAAMGVARQGARVVVADLDQARMDRTVDEILHLDSSDAALALSTDVRSDRSVRAAGEDAIKAMGRVDILINMAGVLLVGKVEQLKSSDWRWLLETNLLGTVRTVAAFLPHMRERGSGHIINAVSGGSLEPKDPLTIAYDTVQVAVASFTRSLAAELEGTGVKVSLYSTGLGGPRIGQNTRSRGLGRLLREPNGLDEGAAHLDRFVDYLIDGLHHPRFLIDAGAGEDAAAMETSAAQ